LLHRALAAAVDADRVAIVELLHKSDVPLDRTHPSLSESGETRSLSMTARAVCHGSRRVLRYLVDQGVDVNTADESGQNALHLVCRKALAPTISHRADKGFRLALIRDLLKGGALADARDEAGRTALHGAAVYLEPEEVRLLLDKGASPTLQDNNGETPRALCERLLAGDYRSEDEPRPWNDELKTDKEERSPWSWLPRIRCEKNIELLREMTVNQTALPPRQ
jgi:hypothetical protein